MFVHAYAIELSNVLLSTSAFVIKFIVLRNYRREQMVIAVPEEPPAVGITADGNVRGEAGRCLLVFWLVCVTTWSAFVEPPTSAGHLLDPAQLAPLRLLFFIYNVGTLLVAINDLYTYRSAVAASRARLVVD